MAKSKKTSKEKAKVLKKVQSKREAALITQAMKAKSKEEQKKAKKQAAERGVKEARVTGTVTTGTTKRTPAKRGKKEEMSKEEQLLQLSDSAKKKFLRERQKRQVQEDAGGRQRGSKKGKKNRDDANRDDESDAESTDSFHPPHAHHKEKLNQWDPEDMEKAYYAVLEDRKKSLRKRIGIRKIAAHFGVPRNTLSERVLGNVKGFGHMSGGEEKSRISNQLFTKEQEQQLVDTIMRHSNSGFPFTSVQVRCLAFDFAAALSLRKEDQHEPEEEALSRKWLQGFMQRNPTVTYKTPQDLSVYRCLSFNRRTIHAWYEMLLDVLEGNRVDSGLCIWNLDETGVQDQLKRIKVLAPSGMKCQQITPGERGQTTTIIVMANAKGIKVPPMVIHKGSEKTPVKPEWRRNAVDAIVRKSENGWVNKGLVFDYGKFFVRWLAEMGLDNMNHAVVLDGHVTHTYNFKFLKLMKDHNIAVICLPPHSSHFLQPLDNAPLACFKAGWQRELRHYVRKHGGASLRKEDFFLVFNRAWRCMTPQCIIHAFRKTGIYPINPHIIPEEHFAPSDLLCPVGQGLQAPQAPQQAAQAPQAPMPGKEGENMLCYQFLFNVLW